MGNGMRSDDWCGMRKNRSVYDGCGLQQWCRVVDSWCHQVRGGEWQQRRVVAEAQGETALFLHRRLFNWSGHDNAGSDKYNKLRWK